MKDNKGNEIILSASKIKTLESCSWSYYCNYELKLPQTGNSGSRRGSLVHALFECLLNPRHRHHFDNLLIKGTYTSIPVIKRFIEIQARKEGLNEQYDDKGQDNFEMIDEMIQVGIQYDFFIENGKLLQAEEEFSYKSEEEGFTIRGFIDKTSVVRREAKDFLEIYDYKTSAGKFEGEDLNCNTQALMYSLYAKRVRKMQSFVRFLFLRFPKDPMQEHQFSNEEIEGFAKYLSHVTEYLKDFGVKKAKSDMACNKPYPKKGEGFTGKLVCGYAKYPGHSNKDGKPYWHCPYKFAYDYYALLDSGGKTVKTAFTKEELTAEENQKIEKKHYAGCPGINQNLNASNCR